MFCHGIDNTFKNERYSYLQLRCNSNKEFEKSSYAETVEIKSTSCSESLDPEIVKVPNSDTLCASVGADERKNDLEGHLILYKIGWNLKPLKAIGMKKPFIELV